ncbi:MAG TPA: hypothetical protein VHE78_08525, partial [Gemmatimonadaceae bacterium]|nr:hypothetical protein [Gemmatimonadaceae bacterium]
MSFVPCAIFTPLALFAALHAAGSQSSITAEALRMRLTAFAHDSMMGRAAGTKGDFMASAYVEHEFREMGLKPAGENGTFFQTVPLVRESVDTGAVLFAGDTRLTVLTDFLLAFWLEATVGKLDNVGTVFGGDVADSSTWISSAQAQGRVVVFRVPAPTSGQRLPGALLGNQRFAGAVAIAVAQLQGLPPAVLISATKGRIRL